MRRRLLVPALLLVTCVATAQELSVSISVSPELQSEPVTGRMFLLISDV